MKHNSILPGVRRGRDSLAMASWVILSGRVRINAHFTRGWERIAKYCVPVSDTVIGGPRVCHAVLPRYTLNSDDIPHPATHGGPHELEKTNEKANVTICWCFTLNNGLLTLSCCHVHIGQRHDDSIFADGVFLHLLGLLRLFLSTRLRGLRVDADSRRHHGGGDTKPEIDISYE